MVHSGDDILLYGRLASTLPFDVRNAGFLTYVSADAL
jgi:hypothetical protein